MTSPGSEPSRLSSARLGSVTSAFLAEGGKHLFHQLPIQYIMIEAALSREVAVAQGFSPAKLSSGLS